MSDSDRDSAAWRRPPSAYLSMRPAQGPVGRPRSLYIVMADGCRLAVDVYHVRRAGQFVRFKAKLRLQSGGRILGA